MVIRTEQVDTFADASLSDFEGRVLIHLRKCFPDRCAKSDEASLRGAIRYGIQRASAYGITAERDVCKYIDLMVVLGRDFDRDPNLPWAAEILTGRRWRTPTLRIDHLYQTAQQHLAKGGTINGGL